VLVLRFTQAGVEKTHPLSSGLTLIGRLPSCDLVLLDPGVSRQHASVRITNGEAFVRDAGSRFGTFLNDQRLQDEAKLAPGDRLRLGEIEIRLEQHVPEGELLSENHEMWEGPATIVRPVAPADAAAATGGGGEVQLVRLLADIGRALVSRRSLAEVLNLVVDHAFALVPAERAFLLLRESEDQALAAKVLRHRDGTVPANPTLSRMVVRRVMRERVAILAADASTDPSLGVTDSILRFNIRSFMCAPLWSRDDIVGVLYVDSPRTGQFTPGDLDALTVLANAAATAIEQARLSDQLLEETRRRERLQRYHSPAVVSRIINATESTDAGLGAHERDVTIMFCDLVGFTALCEQVTPAQAAALLNAFLTRMTDVVFEHEGTLDKFLGDALLAVFGAPFDQPQHALKAVQAAMAMRQALAEMNEMREGPQLSMRIAISTGIALTGDIGSPRRREFTVLGDVVNVAARIEDEVTAPGEIVISGATYARVRERIAARSLGARTLRGRASEMEFFAVE